MKSTVQIFVATVLLGGFTPHLRSQAPDETARPSAARDRVSPADEAKTDKQSITLKAMGANLRDDLGAPIGKIENVVIDPGSGRIEFLLVAPMFPTNTYKMLPIPWQALQYRADQSGMGTVPGANQVFTLKFSREKLQQAPTFERYRWPDVNDPAWRRPIYSFYSVEDARAAGATSSGSQTTRGGGSSVSQPNASTNTQVTYSNDFIGPRVMSAPDASRNKELSPNEIQRRRDETRSDSALPIGARR
jgi:hypothetical protein